MLKVGYISVKVVERIQFFVHKHNSLIHFHIDYAQSPFYFVAHRFYLRHCHCYQYIASYYTKQHYAMLSNGVSSDVGFAFEMLSSQTYHTAKT